MDLKKKMGVKVWTGFNLLRVQSW